ncbi:hypothetical protein K9U40_19505, partial [Xanthobacter autotrophicus]|nr:hypothetical protein [Xanthobacter autotrophicus]
TYNAAGNKISEAIVAADGTRTTDSFDPSTGKITLEVVESSSTYITRNYTDGVVTKVTTLNKTTNYTDTYTYNITGQTYASQHVVTDSTGKVWLTERWHADGTLDYTKSVAADGTTDTVIYNAAGQKISEVIVAPNGDKTTDTFDASTGSLTQKTVDTSSSSTTNYWTDSVLMKTVVLDKATGVTDFYNYNITGQTYTTQHQQVDASGKIMLIERFHADGTLDYREIPHADGSKDTWMYDSTGTLLGHYEIHADGSRVVDNYLQDGTGDIRHDTFSKDMVLLLRDYEHSDGTHTVYSYTTGQQIYGSEVNDTIYLRNMTDNTFHYDGGTDTVLNFDVASSHIAIDQSLADSVSDLNLAQTGNDVTITIDASHAIILKDMQLASVSSSIFVFE